MTASVISQIASRRKALKLSQSKLSELAGLQSANYVCRLEGGEFRNPSFDKVNAVLSALDREESKTVVVASSRSANGAPIPG